MIPGLKNYEEQYSVFSQPIIKPGLEAMQQALQKLGHPERRVRMVHIAGTNGKGSTLTYLEQLAIAHQLKVGAFMSPAIMSVHDQLRINGEAITPEQMHRVFARLQQAEISELLTEFELLTCAAFVLFEQENVELAIIEAGLGGRFDSTNVIEPEVAIIPSIALEHTNFLGTTLADIAWHKAGILKHGAYAVVGQVPLQALSVIEDEAQKLEVSCELYGEHFDVQHGAYRDETYTIAPIAPTMKGVHQVHNAALAIRAFAKIHPLQKERVIRAVQRAQLPFRFERLTPTIYMDGAHNPASAEMLVATIRQQFPQQPIRFVVGILADKAVEEVLTILQQVSDDFVFVDFDNARAMPAQQIMQLSTAQHKRVVTDLVPLLVKDEMITIVTGSLYLLASLRQQLLEMFK